MATTVAAFTMSKGMKGITVMKRRSTRDRAPLTSKNPKPAVHQK